MIEVAGGAPSVCRATHSGSICHAAIHSVGRSAPRLLRGDAVGVLEASMRAPITIYSPLFLRRYGFIGYLCSLKATVHLLLSCGTRPPRPHNTPCAYPAHPTSLPRAPRVRTPRSPRSHPAFAPRAPRVRTPRAPRSHPVHPASALRALCAARAEGASPSPSERGLGGEVVEGVRG